MYFIFGVRTVVILIMYRTETMTVSSDVIHVVEYFCPGEFSGFLFDLDSAACSKPFSLAV